MKKSKSKWWIYVLGILVVLGVVGYLTIPKALANERKGLLANYQLATVTKGDLTAFVGATGTVRSNQSATVAWQTTGIISKVDVVKRQNVGTNAVLAELDETSLPQAVILAQADLVNAQKALDTLLTSSEDRANAQLALVKAQKAVDDAQKKRSSMQFQRASQETIDIAHANLIQAQKALDDATTVYNQNKSRDANDVVYAAALSQYAAAKQKFDQANNNYLYVQDLPSPLDVQEADANLEVAKAQLLTAKTNWEKVKDGPNDQDVAAAQARIDAAQATLKMTKLTAPFGGTITAVNIKPGDQAVPAQAAIQIDDLSHLYVDVDVSEVDIDRVKQGQPVTITLDAIQGSEFQGTVSDVSPVGTTTGGSVNFIVTVEITDKSDQIRPGMTAAANIAVNQLKNVLLVPNRAIRTQNGKRIVYVARNGVPTQVEITLGASSNTASEVIGGDLKEGDQIILNPPSGTNPFGPRGGGGPGDAGPAKQGG
jgi:HlyD family secretion protein